METPESQTILIERIAESWARKDVAGVRDGLIALLERPTGAAGLGALDEARLLTLIIPELEPARGTDQPIVHFLPVLAHSIETVAVVDWLFGELGIGDWGLGIGRPGDRETGRHGDWETRRPGDRETGRHGDWESNVETFQRANVPTFQRSNAKPVAVQTYPELCFRSKYAEEYVRHFAQRFESGQPRSAIFKFATLLHDIAKPQTKHPKPGGGVSFHEHQTIGADVAIQVAERLGFDNAEVSYIGLIVREHMRPGQFADLPEITLRAVRRFFHATGDAGPDVLLHALADHMATRGPHINVSAWLSQVPWTDSLLDSFWGEEVELERPLLNGNELMSALGIPPGPLVGRLLAAVGEAQAGGDISTREEALELARRLFREISSR